MGLKSELCGGQSMCENDGHGTTFSQIGPTIVEANSGSWNMPMPLEEKKESTDR